MELTWRKSSYSGGGGSGNTGDDCVEVAFGSTGPLLRDSKNPGERLRCGRAAFEAMLNAIGRPETTLPYQAM